MAPYSSSSTSSTDNTVWRTWTSTSVTYTSSPSTDSSWTTWNGASNTQIYQRNDVQWHYWITYTEAPRRMANEEVNRQSQEAQRRQQEDQQRRWSEIQKKKELAEKKAQELLKLFLGENQFIKFEKTQKLLVKGSHNGLYLLSMGGYVKKIKEKEKEMQNYCVHVTPSFKQNLPETDNLITLLLGLQNNEKEVIKLANIKHTEPLISLEEIATIQ